MHQGRKRCVVKEGQCGRIDKYFLRSTLKSTLPVHPLCTLGHLSILTTPGGVQVERVFTFGHSCYRKSVPNWTIRQKESNSANFYNDNSVPKLTLCLHAAFSFN